jgi:hypothetical protein
MRLPWVLMADHVIAGTGYRVDMRKQAFFGPSVLDRLNCVNQTPRLSRWFESSIPGLHFVGTVAANSFGPMMRFAYGAGFVSRRLARYLARKSPRGSVRSGAASSGPWAKPTLAGAPSQAPVPIERRAGRAAGPADPQTVATPVGTAAPRAARHSKEK